jgi:hypothetical protein
MAIADDAIHTGQSGHFIGRTLGVAAGHEDAYRRIQALRSADVGSSLPICFRSHAAGV